MGGVVGVSGGGQMNVTSCLWAAYKAVRARGFSMHMHEDSNARKRTPPQRDSNQEQPSIET